MAGPFFTPSELVAAVPAIPITRFAPSPTGYLHLGHVLSMAYVFGIAELIGARVLLRVEDHDRQRCRPEYEQALFDDMAWLGFIPHNWTELTQQPHSELYRQSDRQERYQIVLDELHQRDLTYYCGCSRRDVRMAMGDDSASELSYPGFCRDRQLLDAAQHGIRLKFPSETLFCKDLFLGPLEQTPSKQCGDLLLRDLHGNFTYNFAAVVDDIDQGVNVIIRGQDLTHCVGRQQLLAEILGSSRQIVFGHHPLITDESGQKLSKRQQSEGVIQRRLSGESASLVLGDALWLAGLLEAPRPIHAYEVASVLKECEKREPL